MTYQTDRQPSTSRLQFHYAGSYAGSWMMEIRSAEYSLGTTVRIAELWLTGHSDGTLTASYEDSPINLWMDEPESGS